MAKTIQISNVPDELYAWLEAQAARKGRSLSDHALAQLHRIARKPRRLGEPTWERLKFAQESLRWAKRYVETILKKRYHRSRPFSVPARAAYTAFVVAYGRPFSGNQDRHGIGVPAWWPPFVDALPPDQRVLHERIIEERNTLVAHTDERRRLIQIHQHFELHSGLAYGIGDERFFESSLSLIERLLAAIQPEIVRLEPVEYAKAEERRRQVSRPSQ